MGYWGGAQARRLEPRSHCPTGGRPSAASAQRRRLGRRGAGQGLRPPRHAAAPPLPASPTASRRPSPSLGMLLFAAASYTQPYLIGLAIDRSMQGDLRGLDDHRRRPRRPGRRRLGRPVPPAAAHRLDRPPHPLTLRTKMFDHIQKLSLSFYDRNEVGRVMSRVQNDVTVLQDLLTTGLLTILADFAGLALVIFFLLYQDVQLALITFTVVPVLVVVHGALAAPRPARLHPRPPGHRHRQRQPPGERLRRARDPEPIAGEGEHPPLRPGERRQLERQRGGRAADRRRHAPGGAAGRRRHRPRHRLRRHARPRRLPGHRRRRRLRPLRPALLRPRARPRPPVHPAPAGDGRRPAHLRGAGHPAGDRGRPRRPGPAGHPRRGDLRARQLPVRPRRGGAAATSTCASGPARPSPSSGPPAPARAPSPPWSPASTT